MLGERERERDNNARNDVCRAELKICSIVSKTGDTQGSTAIATELIRSVTGGRGSSSNRASAYLLQAEIAILDERPNAVAAALEAALAQDFRVRERPLYHILEARRCFLLDEYDSAQQVVMSLDISRFLFKSRIAPWLIVIVRHHPQSCPGLGNCHGLAQHEGSSQISFA